MPAASPAGRTPVAHRQADEIAPAEVAAQRMIVSSAYELIRTVRGNMLLARDSRPPGGGPAFRPRHAAGPTVYVDGIEMGGIEVLKLIQVATVHRIRRLSPVDAQIRYGHGHPNGVIEVMTIEARR